MVPSDDDENAPPASSPVTRIGPLPEVPLSLVAVYREHFSFVWRFLRARGASPDLADDLTQETFVIVERKLSTFEGRSSVKTWVGGIALNVMRQSNRRRARETPSAPDDQVFEGGGLQTTPSDHAEWNEAARFVDGVLQQMSPPQREAFSLIDIEGLSSVEAAELLGENEYTVRSRLRVARSLFNAAVARRAAKR